MTSTLHVVASSSSLLVLALGCSGVSDESGSELGVSDDVASDGSDYRSRSPREGWNRRPPPPATGGTGGSGGTTAGTGNSGGKPSGTSDCGACATALACCNTVSGGPRCTFNATTCESLDPVRQRAYVNSCKTFVDAVVRVWSTPPNTCRR